MAKLTMSIFLGNIITQVRTRDIAVLYYIRIYFSFRGCLLLHRQTKKAIANEPNSCDLEFLN